MSGAIEGVAQDSSPLAGKPAPEEMLVDLSRLEREYFECRPDVDDPAQRVSFGTSGHRGSPCADSVIRDGVLYAAATPKQKARLERLSPEAVKPPNLAREPIIAKITGARGNDAAIGGLKVVTRDGWFAARPSGTEPVHKIYAESSKALVTDAQQIVSDAQSAAK